VHTRWRGSLKRADLQASSELRLGFIVPATLIFPEENGISDATSTHWRTKYGGLEVSEMRRLRQLEEENRRLKGIVAVQALTSGRLKNRSFAAADGRVGLWSRSAAAVHRTGQADPERFHRIV
jgi:hypothetical protein